MSWRESTRRRLAQRALERQLAYQQRKAEHVRGREDEVISAMMRSSRHVREVLEAFQPIKADARVIEVGSGAHGLIFYFGSPHGIGVDPLAVSYRNLFPRWQSCAPTVAALGESLPFADHTTHLTLEAAERLFAGLPLQILSAKSNVDEARARARKQPPRHAGDRLKRMFFKNALYEVVARKA